MLLVDKYTFPALLLTLTSHLFMFDLFTFTEGVFAQAAIHSRSVLIK